MKNILMVIFSLGCLVLTNVPESEAKNKFSSNEIKYSTMNNGSAVGKLHREGIGKTCTDNEDNDQDGFIDCADSDCADKKSCENAGVCDVLVDSTPGLYGLCIAFCEAQDCVPDYDLDDPFANCKPSGERLLEVYNKKKQAIDPDMPCIQDECPCYDNYELDDFAKPYDLCAEGLGMTMLENNDNKASAMWNHYSQSCYFHGKDSNGATVNRYQKVTEEDYSICQDMLWERFNEEDCTTASY